MVPSAPKSKPKKKAVKKGKLSKNPGRKKAVSLWTSKADRKLYERARKRFGDSLSELVRVLVAAYNRGEITLTDGTVKVQAPLAAAS